MIGETKCGCCGESVSPLYKTEELEVCIDCRSVYEDGRVHRWDQIKSIAMEIKRERRAHVADPKTCPTCNGGGKAVGGDGNLSTCAECGGIGRVHDGGKN